MINAERILSSLVRNALSGSGRRGRGRSRGARAGLGRSLLGGSQKGALALGALGVAIAAFEHFTKDQADGSEFAGGARSRQNPPPPPRVANPPPPPPPPPTDAAAPSTASPAGPTRPAGPTQEEALLLVRAMIAAAHADRLLDAQERERILEALDASGLEPEERQFLLAEFESPREAQDLAAAASSPDLARQVYLASVMAIEIDTPAEQEYLARLAGALELRPEVVAELEHFVGGAK